MIDVQILESAQNKLAVGGSVSMYQYAIKPLYVT